jgi:hypothetical protein
MCKIGELKSRLAWAKSETQTLKSPQQKKDWRRTKVVKHLPGKLGAEFKPQYHQINK